MQRTLMIALVLGLSAGLFPVQSANAQQVTIRQPFQSVGDRFFENTNIGWTHRNGNFTARFGGGAAPVPFGGFDPNAGISGGFSINRGNSQTNVNFNASQGYQRRHITTTPMVTTQSGQPVSFFAGRQVPFVTGLVPITPSAGFFNVPSGQIPMQQNVFNQQQTLRHPAEAQIQAAIVQQQQQNLNALRARNAGVDPVLGSPGRVRVANQQAQLALQNQAMGYYQKAQAAEAADKANVAKIYYRMAARRASGPLATEIQRRLDTLK